MPLKVGVIEQHLRGRIVKLHIPARFGLLPLMNVEAAVVKRAGRAIAAVSVKSAGIGPTTMNKGTDGSILETVKMGLADFSL